MEMEMVIILFFQSRREGLRKPKQETSNLKLEIKEFSLKIEVCSLKTKILN